MPKKSKEQEDLYLSNIRKLLVVKHTMSLREIQHQLDENGVHLQINYVNRLRGKILRERMKRIDRYLLSSYLASFEDTLTETTQIAWQIATSNMSTRKERIAAIKEIREANKDLFDKLFDSGVFDRKLGVVDHQPKVPLTIEQKAQLIETMMRWGIIKSVEEHEQPTQQLTDADKGAG